MDTNTVEMVLQRSIEVFRKQIVEKPFAALRLIEAHSVKCFLKVDRFVLFPNSRTSRIATLANEHIAFDRGVLGFLFGQETHFEHIRQVKAEPPNI